jgi:phytanoyl-CoA hydroxylase
MRLTDTERAFYAENGYVAVPDIVPAERVFAMRRRIEELCAAWDSDEARRVGAQQEADIRGAVTAEKTGQTVRKFSNLVPFEPIFHGHATDGALLDIVEDLIGAPLGLYADQALLKPPLVGSAKLPHQDNAYFRVEPADAVITCWCALDDATVENGCMHYLAGSHKDGLVDHAAIEGTPHLVPPEFDPDKATAVPLKAGGVVLHHSLTLHYTPDNRTDQWRRAFVCHYVRLDATMPGKSGGGLLRVR